MERQIKTSAEWLVLGAIALGTFGFGAVLGWGLVCLFVPLALAFCLMLGLSLFGAAEPRRVSGLQRLFVFFTLLGTAWCLLQIVPLPTALVAHLSPARMRIQQSYSQALGQPLPSFLTLAVDSAAAHQGFRLLELALITFWLGAQLGHSPIQRHRLLAALIVIVLIEALYGLGEALTGQHEILWADAPQTVATGTFYNRNHFAALLGMFVPISIGWTYFHLRRVQEKRRRDLRDVRSMNEGLFSKEGLWMLAPVVLIVAILESASRGGFASLLFGSALFFALSAKNRAIRGLSWVTAIFGLLTFVYAFTSDYELVLARMSELFTSGDGREIIWHDALGIVRDFPLFGVGLGNFAAVYSRYASLDTVIYPYMAHNEWLEGLVALGAVGMGLVVAALALFFIITFRDLRRHSRGQLWRQGCWCGLAGMALHCFGEFNLHIPSLCMMIFFIAGLLYGAMKEPPQRRRHHHNGKRRAQPRDDEQVWEDEFAGEGA